MLTIKKRLSEKLASVMEAQFGNAPAAEELCAMLEYPPDNTMGDIALPCFKLSRTLRKAPPVIASSVGEALAADLPNGISEAVCAGGYLNFKVSDGYLRDGLVERILRPGEIPYGGSDVGHGKTIVLDYSSPNVAKPFHIGHLGTTVIGHSLKKLHQFAGYNCVGINYLGDWGTQFGKLITAYRLWGNREMIERDGIDKLVELYVRFHEEAESDPTLNDRAREEFAKLEHGDEENLALWRWFVDLSLREYKKTYAQLDIEFDSYKGESFYTDKMPAQVQKLRDMGLLKIDDGASIVDLEEYGMPPCLILKKDGSTLYPTRDIAAAVYRKETYDFDKCIYVTSSAQCLHFAQWFKVVELMGYPWYGGLVHVPYGTVSINGEKLATRTGNVILLRDLFAQSIEKVREIMTEKGRELEDMDSVAEAVGVGAIVYYYLSGSRIKDISFMLEDALSFDGNTGPYAQYTYARTCSILSRADSIPDAAAAEGAPLCDAERELLRTLALFPEKVSDALEAYEPSIVTRYIYQLCAAFNKFYHDCPIAHAESDAVGASRLRMTAAVRDVLGNALHLICMRTPEKI